MIIIYGAVLPFVMGIIFVDNRFTAILTYAVQFILPYILFIRYFSKIGLKNKYSSDLILGRILIASIIWSIALYMERYSYKFIDLAKLWFKSLFFYNDYVNFALMFLYWSFFLIMSVVLSYFACECWKNRDIDFND